MSVHGLLFSFSVFFFFLLLFFCRVPRSRTNDRGSPGPSGVRLYIANAETGHGEPSIPWALTRSGMRKTRREGTRAWVRVNHPVTIRGLSGSADDLLHGDGSGGGSPISSMIITSDLGRPDPGGARHTAGGEAAPAGRGIPIARKGHSVPVRIRSGAGRSPQGLESGCRDGAAEIVYGIRANGGGAPGSGSMPAYSACQLTPMAPWRRLLPASAPRHSRAIVMILQVNR